VRDEVASHDKTHSEEILDLISSDAFNDVNCCFYVDKDVINVTQKPYANPNIYLHSDPKTIYLLYCNSRQYVFLPTFAGSYSC